VTKTSINQAIVTNFTASHQRVSRIKENRIPTALSAVIANIDTIWAFSFTSGAGYIFTHSFNSIAVRLLGTSEEGAKKEI
jgi:hypothetical protein